MNLRTLPRLLLEWLLGLAGIVGALLCLSTAFSVTLPGEGYFLFLGALLLVFCALFRLRQGEIISVAAAVLLAAAAIILRKTLINGFSRLWDVLAEYYARGYDYDFLQNHEAGRAAGAWPALWAIGILEVYFTAVSICIWKKTLPYALIVLLCVGPCFVLIDTPPALFPLLMVVFSITVQALSQSARRREDGEEVRSMLWSSVLAAAILGILLAAVPQDSYRPPVTLEDITDRFSKASEAFDNRGNVAAGLSGNPSSVDLHGLRRLPNRSAVVMRVRSTYTGTVYLRGSSYDRFDGDRWVRSDFKATDELVTLYPGLSSLYRYSNSETLVIEPFEEEDLYYTAYDVVTLPEDAELRGDAWFYNPTEDETYTLRFTPEAAPGRGTAAYEQKLRTYFNYLDLPDATRDGLLAWWNAQTEWTADPELIVTDDGVLVKKYNDVVAAEVAARVSAVAPYSRNPGAAPSNRDFCTWFVNDAEAGYCVHYATVAAAMLRALDVPARYVSGYICHANAGSTVDVTNLHAHAWVEYYSGGRWHILEPTPGDATEFAGRFEGGQEVTTPQETYPPLTEPPATEPPTEPPVESTTEPPTEPPTRPEEKPTEPSVPPEDGDGDSGGSQETGGFRLRPWMWVFPALLLAVLAILLRRRLTAVLWERKYRAAAPNDQAVLLYRRLRRLCRLAGEEPRPEARRLAMKAAFSHHELTREELGFLRQCLDKQTTTLAAAPFFKRMYYRYVLAVI